MRRSRTFVLSLAGSLLFAGRAPANLVFLDVPAEYATIQAAIDAAPEGAVVEVAVGRYDENIDFHGKALVVEGQGPESVIDGGGRDSVVRFTSGEGPQSVLDSFTLTGGLAATGGGIDIENASPTILRNVVISNAATGAGSGMFIGGSAAAPQIYNNLMVFNTGAGGADAHTVQIVGSSPRLVNNTIMRNDSNAILTSGQGRPEIRNNILARNGSRVGGSARGRGICDFAPGTIAQYNLFFRNTVAALLTAGTDFRSVVRAQEILGRASLANNLDGAIRFRGGPSPRTPQGVTVERFIPGDDPSRPSRTLHAGDPDEAYENMDGTRDTIGFTGGPYAPLY